MTASHLLEESPFEVDRGELIGRDPRKIGPQEWDPDLPLGLKAIRAHCLQCSHGAAEVRKCTATDCPLWHLRMGSVPKGLREAKGKLEA